MFGPGYLLLHYKLLQNNNPVIVFYNVVHKKFVQDSAGILPVDPQALTSHSAVFRRGSSGGWRCLSQDAGALVGMTAVLGSEGPLSLSTQSQGLSRWSLQQSGLTLPPGSSWIQEAVAEAASPLKGKARMADHYFYWTLLVQEVIGQPRFKQRGNSLFYTDSFSRRKESQRNSTRL